MWLFQRLSNEANKVERPLNSIVWRETSEFWSNFGTFRLVSFLYYFFTHLKIACPVSLLIHLSSHVQKIWIFLKNPLLLLVCCTNGERDCHKHTPLSMLIQNFYLNGLNPSVCIYLGHLLLLCPSVLCYQKSKYFCQTATGPVEAPFFLTSVCGNFYRNNVLFLWSFFGNGDSFCCWSEPNIFLRGTKNQLTWGEISLTWTKPYFQWNQISEKFAMHDQGATF